VFPEALSRPKHSSSQEDQRPQPLDTCNFFQFWKKAKAQEKEQQLIRSAVGGEIWTVKTQSNIEKESALRRNKS
jgi:hypothetical protein